MTIATPVVLVLILLSALVHDMQHDGATQQTGGTPLDTPDKQPALTVTAARSGQALLPNAF